MKTLDAQTQLIKQYTNYSDSHGNVKMLSAFFYSIPITFLVLIVAWSGQFFWHYYYELYFNRGPIPFIESYLFSLSIAMLILKFFWYKKEKKAYNQPYIRYFHELEKDFTATQLNKISDLETYEGTQSILINRIAKATNRWKKTFSIGAVDEILQASSDLDAELIENSYSLINFFIWVIPIFGFLGTVIGVGAAIGNFGNIITAASSSAGFSAVRDNIGGITDNLALAFDTTLMALSYAAIIMFFAGILKKLDTDMLSGFNQFCHEKVMSKLFADSTATLPSSGSGETGSSAQLEELQKIVSLLQEKGNSGDQEKIERILEDINSKISKEADTEGLRKRLDEICNLLNTNKDAITFGQKIEQLIETNLAMVEKMPVSVDELKSEINRLGEMFAQIYGKNY